jgi:hypothetical protein
MAALASATAISTLTLLGIPTLMTGNSPAGAASIGTLRQRADAIAAQIAADNAHLDAVSATYLSDAAAYQATKALAASLEARIGALSREVRRTRRAVQLALVDAYVAGGPSASNLFAWSKGATTQIQSTTYLGVATGELDQSTQNFIGAQHSLVISLGQQRRAIATEGAAYAAATKVRSSVLATVSAEQTLYNSTNAQLNTLVAQAAAAAAAAAAARARAAAGPPTVVSTSSTPSRSTIAAAPTTIEGALAAIRNCESSGDYQLNTGNGYYGAYQFSESTWLGLGESGLPSQAAPSVQDGAAYTLYQRSGNSFAAWGTCAAIAGLY